MSEKYISQAKAVAARVMDGEMVIMSALDSTLFNLNPVATVIWQAADGRTPLSEIVKRHVCARFDVGPGEACRDAEEFVGELARHGILQVSDQPIPSEEPEGREAA